MKIVILMSTYNGEKYLKKQLDSILNQTLSENIKLYIRDDGSADKTLKIISEYEDKLDIKFIQGENLGPARSFFELMKLAENADYYSLCDQDDIWHRDKLERAVEMLKNENNDLPLLFFSNSELIDENDNSIGRNIHKSVPLIEMQNLLACNHAQGCTMVFNKKLRDLMNKLDLKNVVMHDYSLILTACAAGKILYDFKPTMKYRQHGDNVTVRSGSISKRLKLAKKLWLSEKNLRIYSQASEIYEKLGKENIISENSEKYLRLFSEYKRNPVIRFKLLKDKTVKSHNDYITRNFKIRLLLGLA